MKAELDEFLNREPFAPFRIALTSGQSLDVRHPNLVAVGASIMHVFLPKSDRYVAVRMNQLVSLELLPGNGKGGSSTRRRSR
jgi:hypothetical protein